MFTVEKLNEFLEGKSRYDSPHGVSCFFVPLNEDWGVKVYQYRSTRDRAYNNQKEAFNRFGLAPAVGDTFDLPDGQYCYVTERATPIVTREDVIAANEQGEDAYWELDRQLELKYQDEIDDVENFFAENDFEFTDGHFMNWGRLKDGRLVPIDFGND